jgi:hypothetical protein
MQDTNYMQENNYFMIALNVTVNQNNRKFNDNGIIVKLIVIPKRNNNNNICRSQA